MLRHAFSIGVIVLVATLAVLALHSGRTTEAAEPAPSPFARTEAEVLPGRLLVRFRDGTPPAERAAVHDVTAGRIERLLSSTGTEVVNVDAARLVTAFLAYRNSPHVEYVEPIGVMHATFDCTSGAGTITNDDCSSRQYGLHNDGGSYGVGSGVVDADIDAYDSWSSGYTGAGVTIAVLDTGYDTTHEDLAAKVSLAADFTGTGIEDLNGHGTWTGSIATAMTGNSKGVAGAAPDAGLLVGKVLDNSGSGSFTDLADAIRWATDGGAYVISMSLSGGCYWFDIFFICNELQAAVDYASTNGVLLVAAAGNGGTSSTGFPAAFANVLAVAATDANDGLASFSDAGDVAAPGVDVFGAFPDCDGGGSFFLRDDNGIECDYDYANGTSAATPLVAGAAALVWSANPGGLTDGDVRGALEATATDVPGTTRDGAGRISACDALNSLGFGCAEPGGGPPPGVTVAPTSGLTTTEAGGSDTFSVVLDAEPTADVSIGISSSDATEGTASPLSLTFTPANWDTAQTVTVTGVDDADLDGDVAYSIVIAAVVSADGGYSGLDPDDVGVTNEDDEVPPPGMTVASTAGLATTEAGGSDTFTVVLDSQPSTDVSIAISSSDTSEGVVAPGNLTFTPANWDSARTVTVTGVDDDVDDGDRPYTVAIAAAVSGDPTYNGLDAPDVSATNSDDDAAGISVTPASGLTTTEAGGSDTFSVVLDSQPTADVSIGISSNDASEGTASPPSLTFTPANWDTAQTVTVTGIDDADTDGDVAYSVVTAAADSGDPNYDTRNAVDVAVTNEDDETPPAPSVVLYFALRSSGSVGGLSAQNQDIVAFDGSGFSVYFDGSSVGLGSLAIDAIDVASSTEILLSFTRAGAVPGIAGTVDDSDIVRFTHAAGDTSSGTFSMFFDGSDVGLTRGSEDIDALELLADGTFLLSTRGSFRASGLSGADEDVFACTTPLTGPATSCGSLTTHLDGGDIGLSSSSEDVDALSVGAGGDLYLSTLGNFSTGGVSGADEDVFVCHSPSTGPATSCGSWSLFFDGSAYGLSGNDIYGIDLP